MELYEKIRHAVQERHSSAVSFLRQLVRVRSVTGNEHQAQELISGYWTKLGLDVHQWCPTRDELQNHPAFSDDGLPLGNRPVVVARWAGSGGGRTLILNGHVDVVPAGSADMWPEDPWGGIIHDGRIFGRGTCDMKGGLVAATLAVEALLQLRLKPRADVLLESVIGEETGGCGTLATLLHGYRADAAILLEPTGLNLCPVGSGALSFRLTVRGAAAHGALRTRGVSAVEKFFLIYQALMDFEARRHAMYQNLLFKTPAAPISIGTVTAGDWPSTVPERLVAEGRYGVFPGEDVAAARQAFQDIVSKVAAGDAWLQHHSPELEWFEGQFEPCETSIDSPILASIRKAHRTVLGFDPELQAVPYGSDLRFFTNYAKMPAVLYGPGDVSLAHSVRESLDLNEMAHAATVIALTICDWCGIRLRHYGNR